MAMKPIDRSGLRSAFIPHEPVDLVCHDPSRTREEFADECDINLLMARYEKSGVFPVGRPDNAPAFFDTTLFTTDFREALDMFDHAERSFMTLPASVRREFDNDPAAFVEFATKSENLGKLREWGLAAPEEPPPAPINVRVIADPPAPASSSPAPAPGAPGAPTQ